MLWSFTRGTCYSVRNGATKWYLGKPNFFVRACLSAFPKLILMLLRFINSPGQRKVDRGLIM